jgi:restriction system protein
MGSEAVVPHVWLIRAGQHGEDEESALSEGKAIIGFQEVKDLATFKSRDGLADAFAKQNPTSPRPRVDNYSRQLWAFRETIREGDVVVLPLKTSPGQIALGRVTGAYRYVKVGGALRHTRPVKWTHPDLPRSTFEQDLLYSFGAFLTVCRIRRNNAEHRVLQVLAGKGDPGAPISEEPSAEDAGIGSSGLMAGPDLAQAASDQITAFIRRRFPDHEMARLVEAVLRVEGFQTQRSQPGPDGGADILAGRGPLGLDAPHLCVQVKATQAPADVKVFRELAGTMAAFKANQGLFVCWGGFKQSVVREARQENFKIRLWDQNDLVQAVHRNYEKLPPEIQAELPLKRVWMLVREAEESGA